jgi:hypothetical protein
MSETAEKPWICTDPSTEQYGRKVDSTESDWVYEFKEKGKQTRVINLTEYSAKEVEECINAFGYTLEPWSDDTFIFDIYGNKETVNWIIAECLYEEFLD